MLESKTLNDNVIDICVYYGTQRIVSCHIRRNLLFSKMGGFLIHILDYINLIIFNSIKCFPFENCTHMFIDLIWRKCVRLHINKACDIHGGSI